MLVAVGRGPRTDGFGFEEAGHHRRPRLGADRRAAAHQRRRASTPSATSCPACSWRTAASPTASSWPRRSPGSNPQPIIDSGIPRVTYCEPEVASVGLTEPQAKEKYGEIDDLRVQPRRQRQEPDPATAGLVKLVREKDGPIVGVHMIGARFGEQVGEASLIVNWEAFPEDVAQLIHAHPTQNESLGEAALALAGKPLHAHA